MPSLAINHKASPARNAPLHNEVCTFIILQAYRNYHITAIQFTKNYLLNLNMTTKNTGYENYHFHTHKNGMYNFISLYGYSLKMNMVLKIRDYEKCHFHCHKNRN